MRSHWGQIAGTVYEYDLTYKFESVDLGKKKTTNKSKDTLSYEARPILKLTKP